LSSHRQRTKKLGSWEAKKLEGYEGWKAKGPGALKGRFMKSAPADFMRTKDYGQRTKDKKRFIKSAPADFMDKRRLINGVC
jgi:hypothetical protein